MNLGQLGEFGLIGRIAGRVPTADRVLLGIGDDTAATIPEPGTVTLSTSDMLVEGIHFDLAYSDPYTLGRKSLAVNLSDVAAMGGVPRTFLLSLAIPPTLPVEFVDMFTTGLLEQAARFGVVLIGGDTCASPTGLVISITLLGEQVPERLARRQGACPGDLVCVTGTLGDAAVGLAQLRQGIRSGAAVARHLDPEPRVAGGIALAMAGLPTAMIDISDGLAADLGHILYQSGVGARLELASLPLSPAYRQAVADHEAPLLPALTGGEDYELLFTLPSARRHELAGVADQAGVPCTVIGEIIAAEGLSLIAPDGSDYQLPTAGYDHFPSPR
ncbi:MAG TPA: thiamine-phosphate kinase [Geobacteraceae bacterium]